MMKYIVEEKKKGIDDEIYITKERKNNNQQWRETK